MSKKDAAQRVKTETVDTHHSHFIAVVFSALLAALTTSIAFGVSLSL